MAFTKKQLKKVYREFCVLSKQPPEEVILSCGGALVLLGLRESTDDLDLDVSFPFYLHVKELCGDGFSSGPNSYRWTFGVDIHPIMKPQMVSIVEGIYCYSLQALIDQKHALLARPERNQLKKVQDRVDLRKLIELHEKEGSKYAVVTI